MRNKAFSVEFAGDQSMLVVEAKGGFQTGFPTVSNKILDCLNAISDNRSESEFCVLMKNRFYS